MSNQQMTYEEKVLALKNKKDSERPNNVVKYHTESKLIADLVTTEEVSDFIIKMLSISKGIGIANAPTKTDLHAAFVFISRNFGKEITVKEFSYAFELYSLQKLVIDKNNHHFSTFNFPFISAVIQAYIEYRKPSIQKYNSECAEKRLPEKTIHMSYLEYAKMLHDVTIDYIAKENKIPIYMQFDICYDYLYTEKKIVMSEEEKIRFKEQHKKNLLERAKKERRTMFDPHYKTLIEEATNEELLKISCRSEAAINYYKTLIKR